MADIINLTAEERELIKNGKVYRQGKTHMYYQALLSCHNELEHVFDNDFECVELEELHGHLLREIYRVEDSLNIPHFDQEATDFVEAIFRQEKQTKGETKND